MLQPYKRGRNALTHPLWVLHELTNADKHRTLNMALGVIEELSFRYDYNDLAIAREESFPGPFVNDAVVARLFVIQTGPNPKMKVKPDAMFNVTYDEGQFFGGRKIPTLLKLRDAVAAVVRKFSL